ncbi:type I-E CRISPR-associated protein Cas6/Cse3/CasE [Acidithiobacillus caldus]|jgi:CRISPR system Cascade subunit CasE|uniref:Type I-E CRISPR-associated protein Cas6/Cse3/CasE n=1 Tax=Acidithiobacillus caldus TaxID=33059 RepID=A0A1E7YMA3_9PROT|nr:type I-E CRISPR-associated protein Cas6/Cse3/CasE [Acidithiobacillus caldus]MBU2789389.1 type I-E CRISPR-associated protein Cas6/Cse3/CasE [Acidithiobacillus caldus]MBU2820315.1 type I-E CRISPR-associated protein Cas6/Cse3/CasE [Acidithiobacillus caldus]OFC35073.1 type I-E CRISPR-associated protein Cas6/Cse3/CasE [Acidithiobacillus caldus]OFC36295.1 type I-E CRISPR-associated protein Cas6/Cse3/CasE [Acidithiobacillus caldus]OFC40589.1 type I-E CRISPR-associated protein Cas6/Cse3/CasE [Acidi
MYLTRLTLQPHPDLKAMVQRLGDVYREHQMLWQLFETDPDAQRDFLYRRDLHQGHPRYYLLSRRPPVNSLGLWQIDTPKVFQPKLRSGQSLAFMLRCNPVISRDGKRHDVVMDHKQRMNWKSMAPSDRPPLQEVIEEAGTAWLKRQAKGHGFAVDIDGLSVGGYQRHQSRRGRRNIRYSTLDFTGVLMVTDPESFQRALIRGIGPARAFGCGLMLIRRV